MTGRALVKWTPPAGSSGRSVRGYGGSTLIHDGAVLPVVFGLAFMGVGAAVHQLVLALVVVFVLVSVTAAFLWWITARVQRPIPGLPAPVRDDPRPEPPTPAQVAAMTRVHVEVVDDAPRRALPAAPLAAEPAYPAAQAREVA